MVTTPRTTPGTAGEHSGGLDWLDTVVAAGEQGAVANSLTYYAAAGLCRWCKHNWHGVTCDTTTCRCDSAFTSRDDSWRPVFLHSPTWRAAAVMDETGCDGFVAVLAAAVPLRTRIRAFLYNAQEAA